MENLEFEKIIKEFYSCLIGETEKCESKGKYLKLFSELEIQIEGWFRGEFMNFLKLKGIKIGPENREARIYETSRKKVDFKIKMKGEDPNYWIELKHILIGSQGTDKKSRYDMNTYFSDGTFIDNDIDKLQEIEDKESHNNESRYCLVVVSTNHEGDKSKIKSKETLESEVRNELVKRAYGSKAQLIQWDYNLEKHFGYFMLKVKKDIR